MIAVLPDSTLTLTDSTWAKKNADISVVSLTAHVNKNTTPQDIRASKANRNVTSGWFDQNVDARNRAGIINIRMTPCFSMRPWILKLLALTDKKTKDGNIKNTMAMVPKPGLNVRPKNVTNGNRNVATLSVRELKGRV